MRKHAGRPLSENPKNIQLKIRADESLIDDLNFCSKSLEKTKSEVVRIGIGMVKEIVQQKIKNEGVNND